MPLFDNDTYWIITIVGLAILLFGQPIFGEDTRVTRARNYAKEAKFARAYSGYQDCGY